MDQGYDLDHFFESALQSQENIDPILGDDDSFVKKWSKASPYKQIGTL